MQLVMNQPGMASSKAADDLMVLVACTDFTRGQEICALLERAGRKVKMAGRLIHTWWNFQSLTVPTLRQLAAGEAARADLVILIAQEAPGLPEAVIDWISLWLARREGGPQVLVPLMHPAAVADGIPQRVLAQLQGVAELGQIDLFTQGLDGELEAALTSGVGAAIRRQRAARSAEIHATHRQPQASSKEH